MQALSHTVLQTFFISDLDSKSLGEKEREKRYEVKPVQSPYNSLKKRLIKYVKTLSLLTCSSPIEANNKWPI